jgi:DNA-binding HxlR family transcriptional regulator
MHCNLARAVGVLGDSWTPLILRDVLIGVRQFGEIQRDLGVSTNVLASRLHRLLDHGVLMREPYGSHPHRYEYRLTEKGEAAVPILLALLAWGDEWEGGPDGLPTRIVHRSCGATTVAVAHCAECGEPLDPADIDYCKGPGSRRGPGTEVLPDYLGPQ